MKIFGVFLSVAQIDFRKDGLTTRTPIRVDSSRIDSIRSHFLPSLLALSHVTKFPVSRIDFIKTVVAFRTRKIRVVSLSHVTTFQVSPVDFYKDGSCQTEHTLDIFPFSCTRFKNEEGLCLCCCLTQSHFRSRGPLNRDLISGESRIVNYLRRIDSVWVYWTYLVVYCNECRCEGN